MKRLQDRVALVTGGASGIGAACARRYAAEGARVAVADIDRDGAQAVARDIGGIALACDHTQAADGAQAVAAVLAAWGRLDVLHANAGVGWTGRFDATDEPTMRRVFDGVLLGPTLMARAALAALRASPARQADGAAILFTASGLGVHGRPMISLYSAAKHGVVGLMRSLALELGEENIRVNAVCPGVVDTPMVRATTGGWGTPDEALEMFRRVTPLRRNSTPEDIAASAAFLVSPDARNITGCALLVDGGAHEA
ncbi:MAG: SDR family oxidoreductase [Burkholderiales bacterium]|nr:SDR family oxidoreductase [Burkholderiales bacterium]